MRRFLTALTLAVALPLVAQEAPKTEAAPRFAVFTLGLLVENSSKAKKLYAELETTQKTLNDKLKAKGEEGQKVQTQLQAVSLTEQGRDALKKQLRDIDFEYKKLQEDSQTEFNRVQGKVMGDIFKLAGPIIDGLAKEQKLQVIFSGESAQAGQLIQWADETWIRAFTLEVAKRVDAATGAVPAVAKPAPAVTKPTSPAAKPAAPAKPVVTNP